jgi:1-acyl-sn-glycerol-3-phosphate acyltransferase
MKKLISKIIFQIIGWKVVGKLNYPDKCLVIAAPHTSNWDFFIGRCYAYIIGIVPKYLIKSELFLPILRSLIKWNGGIPVYRHSKNNVVDQITEIYNSTYKFILGISPEGTRSRVERWRTGFYHIAVKSEVPILLLKMDYEKKEIGILNEFHTSGDIDKDLLFIQNQYENIKGKIPKNYNPKIF